MPLKYSVAMSIGFLKGKSTIRIHQELFGRCRDVKNLHFGSRGHCLSTMGLDKTTIRAYTRNQGRLYRGSQGELDFGEDDQN